MKQCNVVRWFMVVHWCRLCSCGGWCSSTVVHGGAVMPDGAVVQWSSGAGWCQGAVVQDGAVVQQCGGAEDHREVVVQDGAVVQ